MTTTASKETQVTCDFCEDADATHVVLADLGDVRGEAMAAYRVACDDCKGRGYMTPEPLTLEWKRWFETPWFPAPNER